MRLTLPALSARAAAVPLAAADHQGAGPEDQAGRSRSRPSPRAWCIPGAWPSCPTAGCWSPSGRGACASSARTASCRRRWRACPRSTPAGRAACSTSRSAPDFATSGAVYLSYAEPRDGGRNGTSVARGKLVADGDGGRLDDVKVIFRQEPVLASEQPLRLAPRLHAGRHAVRHARRPLLGPRRGAEPGQPPGQARAHHARRQPLRRQPQEARLAAGDLVDRPSQRAGRGAPPADRQAVDHRARRARRRRDQHPEAGKNYGWPVITYGRDYSCAEDRRGHGEARHGAADLLLGPVDRPIRRGLLHRRSASRMEGQPVRRRARRPGAAPPGARRRARSWARRSCSPTSASASATCARAPTAPSGC